MFASEQLLRTGFGTNLLCVSVFFVGLPMPVDLAIKDTPDHVIDRLKLRARSNHRSLEGEVLAILEEAVGVQPPRKLTIREVLEEVERSGLRTPADSAAIVRADRDGAKHGR